MRYLTLKEAAYYMRRSERWMRSRISLVPHYRMDNRVLFSESELDTFIERYKVEPQEINLRDVLVRAGISPRRRRKH